jgi:hypothetical protein
MARTIVKISIKGDRMQERISRALCACALLVGLGFAGPAPAVAADESSVDINSPDVMKSLLEQQVGKRVKIKLSSGQDVEGKVAKVGSHAVQLTELVGMELFDATVKLEQITAVIVRVRTK